MSQSLGLMPPLNTSLSLCLFIPPSLPSLPSHPTSCSLSLVHSFSLSPLSCPPCIHTSLSLSPPISPFQLRALCLLQATLLGVLAAPSHRLPVRYTAAGVGLVAASPSPDGLEVAGVCPRLGGHNAYLCSRGLSFLQGQLLFLSTQPTC